ncbi:MAG TPA: hypothetical protein VG797_04910 [Phycisphaerales bacterium]|nr:hypothetical protein [Phycisphaerales bacterium]
MDGVHRVLRRASFRYHFGQFVRLLVVTLSLTCGVMIAAMIASRLFALTFDWANAWMWSVIAAAVAAAAWTLITRRPPMAVARIVDEGAGLKESLSTALAVERESDPWSVAAVEHARRIAGGVRVRQAVPIKPPRLWPVPFAAVAVFFLTGLLPSMDLLGNGAKAKAAEEQKAAVEVAKKDVAAIEEELAKTLSKVGADPDELGGEKDAHAQKPTTPDEIRREAMKKLTAAQDRLADLSKAGQSDAMQAMKDKLRDIDSQPTGPLASLTQALQSGNFDAAKQALDELQKKIESGKMAEEERKKAAEQMKELANKLAQLAQDQKQLEKQLSEAGLDPKLAKNPEALKKALEQAQNLSPEQKQALSKAASACKQAGQNCQKMGGACAGMAAAMEQGKDGASAGEQLGEQLSELEMAEQQVSEMQAAQSQIAMQIDKLGQCNKPGSCSSPNDSISPGPGSYTNQPQQGAGERQKQEAAFNLKKEKSSSKDQGGPIIGSTLVQGDQIKGEAVQQFESAVEAGETTASEAIETKQIPREYHDAIKDYFLKLKKKSAPAGDAAPAGEKKSTAPAPAPSAPARDTKKG